MNVPKGEFFALHYLKELYCPRCKGFTLWQVLTYMVKCDGCGLFRRRY